VAGVHGQPVVLAGLVRVLVEHPDMAVVAKVGTVSELLDGDVGASAVLLDADLDSGKALERNIRRLDEHGYGVLAGSADPSLEQALAAFAAGARGYITTVCDLEDLAPALRRVATGRDWWMSPSLMASLLTESPSRPRSAWASGGGGPESDPIGLSERELETVALYSRGIRRKDVAHLLGIKPETVKENLKRVRQKFTKAGFPAPTRADLYRYLDQSGYPVDDLPDSGPAPRRRHASSWLDGKPGRCRACPRKSPPKGGVRVEPARRRPLDPTDDDHERTSHE
jgi:DNA-binding NarL/FixJ family response regulator